MRFLSFVETPRRTPGDRANKNKTSLGVNPFWGFSFHEKEVFLTVNIAYAEKEIIF